MKLFPFWAALTLPLVFFTACASNNTVYNQQANARHAESPNDRLPRLIYSENPIFPPGPRIFGKQDWQLDIDVGFVVDTTGAVRDPFIVKSTDAFYDPLALECIRKWRFEPGIKDGKPVATRMVAPFRFRMNSDGVVK